MFYKIYNVFDFVEYFCNSLVLFQRYDHLSEILSTIDDFWNFFHFFKYSSSLISDFSLLYIRKVLKSHYSKKVFLLIVFHIVHKQIF